MERTWKQHTAGSISTEKPTHPLRLCLRACVRSLHHFVHMSQQDAQHTQVPSSHLANFYFGPTLEHLQLSAYLVWRDRMPNNPTFNMSESV